jgi:hypothetical protein
MDSHFAQKNNDCRALDLPGHCSYGRSAIEMVSDPISPKEKAITFEVLPNAGLTDRALLSNEEWTDSFSLSVGHPRTTAVLIMIKGSWPMIHTNTVSIAMESSVEPIMVSSLGILYHFESKSSGFQISLPVVEFIQFL